MKIDNMDEIKVKELANILKSNRSLEFQHKGFYYQIFERSEIGYVINIYSSNAKDEDGDYFDYNLIDGGFCNGNAKDAVEFLI